MYAEIVNNAGFVETRICNAGGRVARDVRLTVIQDVVIEGYDERGVLGGWRVLQIPIPALVPGGIVKESVAHFGSARSHIEKLPPERRLVRYRIDYQDGQQRYSEEFNFDLSHLLALGRPFPEPTVYHALSELRDHVTTALNRTGDILGQISSELRDGRRRL